MRNAPIAIALLFVIGCSAGPADPCWMFDAPDDQVLKVSVSTLFKCEACDNPAQWSHEETWHRGTAHLTAPVWPELDVGETRSVELGDHGLACEFTVKRVDVCALEIHQAPCGRQATKRRWWFYETSGHTDRVANGDTWFQETYEIEAVDR